MSPLCRIGIHRWRYFRDRENFGWKRCTRVGCQTVRWQDNPPQRKRDLDEH